MAEMPIRPKSINVSKEIMRDVERHAYSNLEAEVGGMFFGDIEGKTANVSGFVAATRADAEQMTLTFTHEVWNDILNEGQKLFPGKQIIGWYHTHPNFGLFLSEYDKFIQENFFSSAGQFALVIDPVAGKQGWFLGSSKSSIKQVGEEKTATGPKQPKNAGVAQKTSQLGLVAAFAGTAVFAGLVGFGLSSYVESSETQVLRQTNLLLLDSKLLLNSLGAGVVTDRAGNVVAFAYPIQPNENLENVALKFFGDADQNIVNAILSFNQGLTSEEIQYGTQILIPKQLPKPEPTIEEPKASPSPAESLSSSPSSAESPVENLNPKSTPTPTPSKQGS